MQRMSFLRLCSQKFAVLFHSHIKSFGKKAPASEVKINPALLYGQGILVFPLSFFRYGITLFMTNFLNIPSWLFGSESPSYCGGPSEKNPHPFCPA